MCTLSRGTSGKRPYMLNQRLVEYSRVDLRKIQLVLPGVTDLEQGLHDTMAYLGRILVEVS